MAIHPDVAHKMREEVLEHCGPHVTPTYESIKNLKYSQSFHRSAPVICNSLRLSFHTVRAVINETLRLFPPVPLNSRESRASACALPPSDPSYTTTSPGPPQHQPLYMPGSTPILFFPLLTQRNPALWGADADTFDPERWIQPARLKKITANPMMFTPFSAGPRIVRSPLPLPPLR